MKHIDYTRPSPELQKALSEMYKHKQNADLLPMVGAAIKACEAIDRMAVEVPAKKKRRAKR